MIVLATLNARYSHAAMGLRCLYANMGELQAQTQLCEFTINDDLQQIAERIHALQPRIVGFGVYIWNLQQTRQLLGILRRILPDCRIILGGPEVTHAEDAEPVCQLADHVINGEADLAFAEACQALLDGQNLSFRLRPALPDLAAITLPYAFYTDEDLQHRLIYVEASRGCPFTCEFCLSSLDQKVRQVPLERFLDAMDDLLQRGCRCFKFVDRTFNLSPATASAIMDFFLKRWREDLFLHFEMVPDRLPDAVRDLLPRFPAGAVQFEIGIQSLTPVVGGLISRRMDLGKTSANFRFIREHTHIHVHADLIVGLPGETLESFASSFNQLWHLAPGEIQVGILKLLKGTPIARHQQVYGMRFNPEPPFDILESKDFPFPLMQRMKRFARYVDIFVNSRRFERSVQRMVGAAEGGACQALLDFSDWLYASSGQTFAISLKRQYELCGDYLRQELRLSEDDLCQLLAADFLDSRSNPTASPRGLPLFLRPHVDTLRRERHYAGADA